VARLEPTAGAAALQQLIVLATLRRLEKVVEQEARKMPILVDILENQVLGREYKRGLEEGRQEGRQEGELALVRRQIEKRFGSLPEWANARLAKCSVAELEELGLRVLDCPNLEELLK
jgi:predicted transposase YdaD